MNPLQALQILLGLIAVALGYLAIGAVVALLAHLIGGESDESTLGITILVWPLAFVGLLHWSVIATYRLIQRTAHAIANL